MVPHVGPSIFVPLCDTVGLDYPDQELTPVNPGGNSHSLPGTPSDEDEEGVSISSKDNFPAGIMIPETKGAIYGERQRPRSIAKMPADSSIGGSNRRPPVSLVSTLFQTPPSPSSAMLLSHKFKRRANICRPAPKYLPKAKEPNENMRSLQLQTYTRTGRVGNFSQVLFNFPRFSRLCRQVTDLFLSSESVAGPLPQTWRIYLGRGSFTHAVVLSMGDCSLNRHYCRCGNAMPILHFFTFREIPYRPGFSRVAGGDSICAGEAPEDYKVEQVPYDYHFVKGIKRIENLTFYQLHIFRGQSQRMISLDSFELTTCGAFRRLCKQFWYSPFITGSPPWLIIPRLLYAENSTNSSAL